MRQPPARSPAWPSTAARCAPSLPRPQARDSVYAWGHTMHGDCFRPLRCVLLLQQAVHVVSSMPFPAQRCRLQNVLYALHCMRPCTDSPQRCKPWLPQRVCPRVASHAGARPGIQWAQPQPAGVGRQRRRAVHLGCGCAICAQPVPRPEGARPRVAWLVARGCAHTIPH